MSELIDISQTLRPEMPVWPGDTAFDKETTWYIDDNCPVMVSKLSLSTHSGSHADAPCHYDANGSDISNVELTPYIGLCTVIDVSKSTGHVNWKQVSTAIEALRHAPKRILFRTYRKFPHEKWDSNFRAIDANVVSALAAKGCLLIGTDAPSIDPESSKELAAHNAIREAGMAILEGLVLDHVVSGSYELIAPPLKIKGGDASPVRALLKRI